MRRLLGPLAVAALLLAPASAHAQVTLGPGLAWHDDLDLGISIWGFAPTPSLHENLSIGGDVTFFFPDAENVDYFEVNANGFYWFRDADLGVTPFALGGLNIARSSVEVSPGADEDGSDVDLGFNAGGGISFGSEDLGFEPIVGVKIELGGGKGFVLFGGVGFPLG